MDTHPRIFSQPLPPAEALKNIQGLLALAQVRTLSEDEGFMDVYQEVTNSMVVRVNLAPDAHLAARLRQHEIPTLYSDDSDFRKLPWLTVRNPLT